MKASLLLLALPTFLVLAAQLPGQLVAQQPNSLPYTQKLTLIKVQPGKGSEWLKMTREESMKLAKMRVDAGEIVAWTLLRSVYPAGEEARAHYAVSVLNEGPPARPKSITDLEADLKKAGLEMSAEDYRSKRNAISTQVATELWRIREHVAAPQKDHYVFLNFMKVHDTEAYNVFESKVWRPMAESWVTEGAMSGWLFATKILPGGTDTVYSAYSADMFPTWEAAFANRSMEAKFEKTHPGKSYQQASTDMPKLRSLSKRELWMIVERVDKSKK